jgi:hypothetical protein
VLRLNTEEYTVFAVCYGLELPPNFEGRVWHLRVVADSLMRGSGAMILALRDQLS